MRRVSIIGSGGAGKSTLASQLGNILGLPVIYLDREHWKSGWQETPKNEWRRRVEEIVAGETWITDGNYGATMEIRLAASDTIIYLDYPRRVCIYRAIKRWVRYRNQTRPDMAEGCTEKFNLEFLEWLWQFPTRSRPRIERLLTELRPETTLVRLTSPAETERYLEQIRKARS